MCILLHHGFKNSRECSQISASLPPCLAGMGGMPVPPRSKSNLLLTAKPLLAKWVSASVHARMHATQSCFLLGGWGGGGLGACSLMGKGLFVLFSLGKQLIQTSAYDWAASKSSEPVSVKLAFPSRLDGPQGCFAAIFQLCLLVCWVF